MLHVSEQFMLKSFVPCSHFFIWRQIERPDEVQVRKKVCGYFFFGFMCFRHYLQTVSSAASDQPGHCESLALKRFDSFSLLTWIFSRCIHVHIFPLLFHHFSSALQHWKSLLFFFTVYGDTHTQCTRLTSFLLHSKSNSLSLCLRSCVLSDCDEIRPCTVYKPYLLLIKAILSERYVDSFVEWCNL